MSTGCQQGEVDKVDSPARTIREAKARLVAKPRWIVGELLFKGESVYKREPEFNPYGVEFDFEWFRFNENGVMEVKFVDEVETDKSRYKIDEINNRILFYFDNDSDASTDAEEWSIEAGSVYSDHFAVSYTENQEKYDVRMVALP